MNINLSYTWKNMVIDSFMLLVLYNLLHYLSGVTVSQSIANGLPLFQAFSYKQVTVKNISAKTQT